MTICIRERRVCQAWLTISLVSMCTGIGYAQRVIHLDIKDGLSTNTLTDLTPDRHGNMWIGSYNGLMKYTGTHIKSFTSIGQDSHSISGPEMHSVTEDNCGFIWIGTTAGLDKINPVTYEIQHYPIVSLSPGSTFVGYIYAVFADRYDFIWFSTDVALFKLDSNTGVYESIPIGEDGHSIPQSDVLYNGFVEDENGLWFSTGGGMTYYRYDTGLFYHRYHNPESKTVFKITQSRTDIQSDVEMDAEGHLWFVLEHKYLVRYNIAADQVDTFLMNRPEGTWRCCYSIGIDSKQHIWIGTRHGGVLVFNPDDQTFISLKDNSINRLLQSDYIYSIESGPDGRMFVAHDNGLDIIDLYDESLQPYRLSAASDFTNLKFQSADIYFDEREQTLIVPFYHFGFFTFRESDERITPVMGHGDEGMRASAFIRKGDKMYVAEKGNLYEMKIVHDELQIGDNKLLPDDVEKARGTVIWAYLESPESVYIKKGTGKVYHIHGDTTEEFSGSGFKPNICISPDSQVLTYLNAELNLVRRNMKQRQDVLINVQGLLEGTGFSFANPRHIVDDGSSIWMTGQNGILRYHYPEAKISTYGMEKGLSHSFTFSIVLDAQLQVWVGSIGGIDRFDPSGDRFESVYKMNDNTYMDAFGHALHTQEGTLFFHFGNKLIRLDPDQTERLKWDSLKLQLKEVSVNGINIDFLSGFALKDLPYKQNRISITCDIPLFDHAEWVNFFYSLNGKDWINNGHRNEVTLDGLAPGTYLIEMKATVENKSWTTPVLVVPFSINPPFWRTWWFMTVCVMGLGSLAFHYSRQRFKRLKERSALEIQMAHLKSTALKAQMNPHFIFNSLNAIQECIVTEKVDEAYTYLSKFSRLLRLVLEQSEQPTVFLQYELEVLSLYLSLEQLRFKDEMTYSIDVDPSLETDEISLSPMVIQPYIENAVWHGLRYKEGNKILLIQFTEHKKDYIEVVIEDNGIGRAKSEQLRQQQLTSGHKRSMGMKLSGDQLLLIQKNYPETSIQVEDLLAEDGNPAGTRVTIVIPILKSESLL